VLVPYGISDKRVSGDFMLTKELFEDRLSFTVTQAEFDNFVMPLYEHFQTLEITKENEFYRHFVLNAGIISILSERFISEGADVEYVEAFFKKHVYTFTNPRILIIYAKFIELNSPGFMDKSCILITKNASGFDGKSEYRLTEEFIDRDVTHYMGFYDQETAVFHAKKMEIDLRNTFEAAKKFREHKVK
jgi:hypothetical protein